MLFARSTVAAARRESLIAFYGPFASALLLIAVIVSRGSSGIQSIPETPMNAESDVILALESTEQSTGFTPFIGSDSEFSVQIIHSAYSDVPPLSRDVSVPADALQPQLLAPLPASAIVVDAKSITSDSSEISIEESIQRELDRNTLLMRQQTTATQSESKQQRTEALLIQTASVEADGSTIEPSESEVASWSALMLSLENNPELSLAFNTGEESGSEGEDPRFQRPSATQRPVLPPTQLSRPIQRAGLLPPPIRPLIP